jgi:hypothetical protein
MYFNIMLKILTNARDLYPGLHFQALITEMLREAKITVT